MLKLRHAVLDHIASGNPLRQTLDLICMQAERLFPTASCTVLSVDPAGMMHPVSSPSFPDAYSAALDGLVIGPNVGSCGSAIYHNRLVSVEDIEHDPKWASFKTLALPLGYKACSSTPIRDESGNPIGALAVYFREKHPLSDEEQKALIGCTELCEAAFNKQQRVLGIRHNPTIDPLTSLPNRAAFDDALLQLRCEFPGSWALFVADLDNLKAVNNSFGYRIGNELIRTIGQRLATALAPDMVFRTGSGEFTAIIQDQQSLQDLYQTADRILAMIAVPIVHEGDTLLPGATIGGAVLAPQDTTPLAVRRNADFALHHAKATQRGGFVRYWPGIGSRMVHRRDAVREVLDALEDQRIEVRYQPILQLGSNQIIGFEALSSMMNTTGRALPASVFQEAFSDAVIAPRLTRYVLASVARDIRLWLDQGLPVQHVGINVTSADFYLGDLHTRIEDIFLQHNAPLKHLIVEVTEHAYLGQRDRVVEQGVRNLKMRGMRVALDDFGTGFAALTHLLTLPADIIKIDQSFVRKLQPGHPAEAVIRGILQIASDLNITVVAEGLETLEQIEMLKAMNCKLGQGYAFSRSVSFEKTTELLRRHGQYAAGVTPLIPQEWQGENPAPAAPTLRVA